MHHASYQTYLKCRLALRKALIARSCVPSGSGSWDPFVGTVATYQTLDYQVDAQISYKNGFEFGDELRLDGSLQYRQWPRELGAGVPGFLYGVIEANLLHRDENEINGIEDGDSGGTSLHLSPGLCASPPSWPRTPRSTW